MNSPQKNPFTNGVTENLNWQDIYKMTKQQILRLQLLGINTNQVSLYIFDDLLKLAEELYEEVSIKREDEFRRDIYRLSRKATN